MNSRPLLHPFLRGLVEAPFEMVIDTPSALAERFGAGDLDIALIPSIEYGRIPDALIAPVVCIASLGKVETVLLFSEMGLEDIRSVAVDPKSKTSVAMLQILFRKTLGIDPQMTHGGEDPEDMLDSADAGLVIGDRAFTVDRKKYVVHDLGELWYKYSGRPFVHAVLCVREGKRWDAALEAIAEAKLVGLRHRRLIAKRETNSPNEADKLYDYLTSRIFYDLGEYEIEGLQHFLQIAKSMGLAGRDDLKFYRQSTPDLRG